MSGQSRGESGKDREHQDKKSGQHRSSPAEAVARPYRPAPPALPAQPVPLVFPSSKAREEGKPHQTVIQATGLGSSAKPLALVTQPRAEGSASPKPLPPCPSPKPVPLPLSLSASPKPLSLTLSPSSKPKSLTPSPKPPALSPEGGKASGRSLPDEPLPQIRDFRLQQVRRP